MRYAVLILALSVPVWAQVNISFIGQCAAATTSCTPPAHQIGDLFIAYAGRNASTTAPTLPSGWTSVTTATAGSGSSSSSVRMACKVATTTSETVTGFTNADHLLAQIYRNTLSGSTATCASTVLGTPTNNTSVTAGTTETFNAVTNTNSKSWDMGAGYCSACTAGIPTAPTGMQNRSSSATPPSIGGHDTNGGVASFSSANVTLTTSGRIVTTVVEIKAPVDNVRSANDATGVPVYAEKATRIYGAVRTATDTVTPPSETSTRVYGAVRAPADTVVDNEKATRLMSTFRTLNDQIVPADLGTRIVGTVRSSTDSLMPPSETSTRLLAAQRVPVDNTQARESPTRTLSAFRSSTDQAQGQESSVRVLGAIRAATDASSILQESGVRTMSTIRTQTDQATPQESSGRVLGAIRSSTDQAQPKESPSRLLSTFRSPTDNPSMSEQGTRVVGFQRAANEGPPSGDVGAGIRGGGSQTFPGGGPEGGVVSEFATRVVTYYRAPADTPRSEEQASRVAAFNRTPTPDATVVPAEQSARSIGYTRFAVDTNQPTGDMAQRTAAYARSPVDSALVADLGSSFWLRLLALWKAMVPREWFTMYPGFPPNPPPEQFRFIPPMETFAYTGR